MIPEDYGLEPFQLELIELLREIDIELAGLYQGALAIITSDSNPAKGYFIAHAAREIVNRLPEYLGVSVASRLEYAREINSLAVEWRKDFPRIDSAVVADVSFSTPPTGDADGNVEVSRRLFDMVDRIITAHEETSETLRSRMRQMVLAIQVDPEHADEPHLTVISARWLALSRTLVKLAHFRGYGRAAPSYSDCLQQFAIFERQLFAVLADFYKPVEMLDEILEAANERAD